MLVIAGEIGRTDPEAFRFYTTLLETLNGRDDIRWVNEHVPDDRAGLLLTAADVVVLPYVKTYTSGVLMAAYAAGKAVVATETGALPEMVEPGMSGLLVPPGN